MESNKESIEILELFKTGDSERASTLLYKKVFPLVKRFILHKGGTSDDAFDMFQDALVMAYKMISDQTYDTKYNVLGYVYNLSLRKWFNKIKKDTKITYVEEIQNLDYISNYETNTSFKHSEDDNELFKTFFHKIGDRCKEILTYTIFKDLSLEDIMHRMEFGSIAAVKMQHKRCKEKVIAELHQNPKLLNKLKDFEGYGI